MRRTTQRLALLAAAGFGLWLAGCGFSRYHKLPESGATLEGTVTYGTEKVEVALVIVQGEGGAQTAFIRDGRYKMDNVPLGAVHIAINTEAGKGEMMGRVMAQSQGKGQGPLPKVIEVPAKYANPTTSGIETTVNKGDNTFDIVIPK
jgi:hypothetical protein